MNPERIRKMTPAERKDTLLEMRQELMHERGVAAMGGAPPDPGRIRQLRRTVARIKTIINEEENS